MPRYSFDVIDSNGQVRDEEGLELSHTDAMASIVTRILLDLANDEMQDERALAIEVSVRDDTDFTIYTGTLNLSCVWRD